MKSTQKYQSVALFRYHSNALSASISDSMVSIVSGGMAPGRGLPNGCCAGVHSTTRPSGDIDGAVSVPVVARETDA